MEAWPQPWSHSCPETPFGGLPASFWMRFVLLYPNHQLSRSPNKLPCLSFSSVLRKGPETALQTVSLPSGMFVNYCHITHQLVYSHWLHTQPDLFKFTIQAPHGMYCGLYDPLTRLFPALHPMLGLSTVWEKKNLDGIQHEENDWKIRKRRCYEKRIKEQGRFSSGKRGNSER